MKITKRQLRRIIREEKVKILREQLEDKEVLLSRPGGTQQTYWPEYDKSHEYEGVSGTSFSQEALDDMQQAIDYFRERGTEMSEADAQDLERIRDMAVKELSTGAEYPSDMLYELVAENLDTAVREEIPYEIYQWATSWDDTRDVE